MFLAVVAVRFLVRFPGRFRCWLLSERSRSWMETPLAPLLSFVVVPLQFPFSVERENFKRKRLFD